MMNNFRLFVTEHWLVALLLGVLLALALYLVLRYRGAIAKFFNEVVVELQKATWPWDPSQTGMRRYKELIDSTMVVVVSTVLLAGFVTFADFMLMRVIGFLTRYGIS